MTPDHPEPCATTTLDAVRTRPGSRGFTPDIEITMCDKPLWVSRVDSRRSWCSHGCYARGRVLRPATFCADGQIRVSGRHKHGGGKSLAFPGGSYEAHVSC